MLLSELDLHAVRFGCQCDSEEGSVVWLPGILRPYEPKLSQQCNRDQEELHTRKALSKTHTRT